MWFFDTPGTPGGASIVERNFLGSKQPVCIPALTLPFSQWLFGLKKNSFDHWLAPKGPRGVKKSHFFLQMKLFSFYAKITPKRHKLQKPSKLKKKCQTPLFFLNLDVLWNLCLWGAILAQKKNSFIFEKKKWFFDTPGTPGGGSIVERMFFWVQTATVVGYWFF